MADDDTTTTVEDRPDAAAPADETVEAPTALAAGPDPIREARRTRLILPILLPIGAAVMFAVFVLNESRILLAAGQTGAIVLAVSLIVVILGGAAIISSAPRLRTSSLIMMVSGLFIVLIVAVRYGASVLSLSLIIGGFSWLVPARLIRGEVLSLRERDFVSAARVAGSSQWRLIRRHLLPNAFGVVIVNVTFQVADAILIIASLGFLGFGLHWPHQDWGDLLSNGVGYLQDGYWWQIYPVGACIVLVVMACNLIGDALRDSLDVRLRRR